MKVLFVAAVAFVSLIGSAFGAERAGTGTVMTAAPSS